METLNDEAPEPLRFAHPFFTDVAIADRASTAGVGNRMTDFIVTKLEPIPVPQKTPPNMLLSDIVGSAGATAIQQSNSIIFHAIGDTFDPSGINQEMVADAMTTEYNASQPNTSPAFMLHLGDVNYYNNTDKGYHQQFYVPYKLYPGKIIAIPGNHDGELFKYDGSSVGQTTTLQAFIKNFCQDKPGIPPAAGTIFREMVAQPGVYWMLDTPFVQIIGLYSNMAENPGYISAPSIGTAQKDFLTQTLKTIAQQRKTGVRKGLIIATHHPPYSNAGHSGSSDMLADIDDSCNQAGIMPDAFLSGHAHNYQRYTRTHRFSGAKLTIPYIIAGTGGRLSQPIPAVTGVLSGESLLITAYEGYGYLTIQASPQQLNFVFTKVAANVKTVFDKVSVIIK